MSNSPQNNLEVLNERPVRDPSVIQNDNDKDKIQKDGSEPKISSPILKQRLNTSNDVISSTEKTSPNRTRSVSPQISRGEDKGAWPDHDKKNASTHSLPYESSNATPLGTSKILASDKSEESQLENSARNRQKDVESRTLQSIQPVPYSDAVILPKRYVLLLMLFLGFAVIYSLRVNINVAIVAMVNNKTVMGKDGKIEVFLAEFNWDTHVQALVVGSFYYGYWVLQVPGAWIAMKLGGTRIFGYGVLLSSLLSLITPVATRYHVLALVGIRIVQGLFLGVTYPCNIAIWAKWAPPLERSTMVTMAIAGSPVGNIVAIPVTGLLSKYGFDGGWPSVFYFFGTLGVLWYIVWELIVYDSPSTHPRISRKERRYIEKSIGEKPFDPLTEKLPWRAILCSVPMWGIIIGHFGACWGYYTLFTQMPTYLKDIQHLDIKTMGLVAATPYIFKAFLGPLGGISADMLVKYKYLSIRAVRTLFYAIGKFFADTKFFKLLPTTLDKSCSYFPASIYLLKVNNRNRSGIYSKLTIKTPERRQWCLSGCIFAGFFIMLCGYYDKKGQAIAFLILGIGFSGLNQIGYAVNHLDIAPRYAGVLMGISNTFATVPGFLSPLVTGHIARNKVASEWRIVFWITFIIYIIATILYALMCSGDKQWWAEGYPNETISEEPTLDQTTDDITTDEESLKEVKTDTKTKSN